MDKEVENEKLGNDVVFFSKPNILGYGGGSRIIGGAVASIDLNRNTGPEESFLTIYRH